MTQNTAQSLPMIDRERLLQRFLTYVKIDTTADPTTDQYPSSPGQKVLGAQLADELTQMGALDVRHDPNGLVWATIPASSGMETAPTVLFNSHVDTSPEAPGCDVNPQVIEYNGGEIHLANGSIISEESTPELKQLSGKTLITTDGNTLLGGDDKAGVAIIMELAQTLIENSDSVHGPVRILFTCDEEIGRGAQHFNVETANAAVGYTLDGGGIGIIDEECFSANAAVVRFRGRNIHPAIAKNRMVSAIRAASLFVSLLPRDRISPETTDGRDGFVHPHNFEGTVEEATVHLIIRDFDTDQLHLHQQMLEQVANEVVRQIPGVEFDIKITEQYRNMADEIKKIPQAIDHAICAFKDLGIEPKRDIIRGGTDGAQMTAMGLPTPNLSSGQYNIHSKQEFACLDDMLVAVQHGILLLRYWASQSSASQT